MSDPVTNVEIEDVLASIRRLVSDEPASSDTDMRAQTPKADKLVLTPSLRVADGRDMAPAQSEDRNNAPVSAMRLGEEYAVPVAEEAPSVEAAEVESLSTDDAADNVTAVMEVEAEIEVSADTDTAEDIPLEDRIAGLEAAVAATDDQWEPDGGEEDAFANVEVEAPYWEDDGDEELSAEVTPLHADLNDDVADEDADVLEADVLQPEPLEDDSADADGAAALDDLAGLGLAQGMIDEEMLRELVAEIVRQELQGSLGERITRNVRKLVRREIQRALTSRDLS